MIFDLSAATFEAEARFGPKRGTSARKRRSDAGESRLAAPVAAALTSLLRSQERPRIREVQGAIQAFCRHSHLRAPSRTTLYRFVLQCPPRQYDIAGLPQSVRDALHNLDHGGSVPGHQLVFYAFNYGDPRAVSFAAELPWLELYQADRMRGWRPKSHGLFRTVMRARQI